MLAEAMMKGIITAGKPAQRLASKPEVIKGLSLYRTKVNALGDLGLGFAACTLEALTKTAFKPCRWWSSKSTIGKGRRH
jgi:hypothetical protein